MLAEAAKDLCQMHRINSIQLLQVPDMIQQAGALYPNSLEDKSRGKLSYEFTERMLH